MPKKVVSSTKKATPKKVLAKKTVAKKAVTKAVVKKAAAKKIVAKKPVAKKSNTKKTAAKKPVVKKAKVAVKAVKKPLPKKTTLKPKSLKVSAKRKKVSPIPKGYSNVTPHLMVTNAAQAIDFYKKVFAAKEGFRMENEGKVTHAELKIGNARIMLADISAESNSSSPSTPSVGFHLYIKDCDATINAAINAGAKLLKPAEDLFYGDRAGMVQDPFGHNWHIATHIEDVSPATQKKRAKEFYGNAANMK